MTFTDSARRIGFEITGSPIRGGSGVVHRATDITTGKEVAIKALAPGYDLKRLEREAKILATVEHRNVARLQGFEIIDGTAALIIDWVDGQPLTKVLEQSSRLPVKRALDIFEQVGNALDAAHRAGVVHRDVNPSNIMIGPDERATVIDFGLSRGTETATVTIEGAVTGTPKYLAPEVIEGAAATPRSDQYSTAMLLHEMLTGSWPYPETASVAGALHHHRHSIPRPLDEITPLLGAGLTDAVLTALSKNPEDRFLSMEDFVAAVRDPAALAIRERKRRSFDRPALTLGLPLLVAALLGLVLYLSLRSDSNEPDSTDSENGLSQPAMHQTEDQIDPGGAGPTWGLE